MSVRIAGIGTWLPDRIRTNAEWPAEFTGRQEHADRSFNDIPPPEDPLAARILARDLALEAADPFLGAVRRRVAEETTTAPDAEARAARLALEDAGITAGEVDLLLSYAIVPDTVATPTGCYVADAIGARRAAAIGVEAACATSIVQLQMARAHIEAGLADVVLLTQSHLFLRVIPMVHPAAPGLGDGATAMVVTRGDEGIVVRSTFAATHGEYAPSVAWVRGRGDGPDAPWWKAGPDYRLGTQAPSLLKVLMRDTVSFGALTVQEAARRASLDVERIGVLASVQPRGFIPAAIAERLGLDRGTAVTTYEDIAHVGACGPVFNLDRARRLGRLTRGTSVALYGQGSGFTRAGAILEVV